MLFHYTFQITNSKKYGINMVLAKCVQMNGVEDSDPAQSEGGALAAVAQRLLGVQEEALLAAVPLGTHGGGVAGGR